MPNYDASPRSVAYVRDRIQTLMSSTVCIYSHGEQRMDSDGVVIYVLRSPLYEGKARVRETETGATLVEGEAAITLMQTNISIPWGSYQPKKDDIVRVTVCPVDASLVGRAYRVVSVNSSGQMGAVHLMTVTSFSDSAVWES